MVYLQEILIRLLLCFPNYNGLFALMMTLSSSQSPSPSSDYNVSLSSSLVIIINNNIVVIVVVISLHAITLVVASKFRQRNLTAVPLGNVAWNPFSDSPLSRTVMKRGTY